MRTPCEAERTDSVMLPTLNRNPKLGTDAVCAANQQRVGEPSRFKVEATSEPSNLTVGAGSPSGLHRGLDSFDQRISSIDRDAGAGIGQAGFWR